MGFDYGPTPEVLQGLSAGQFASRWQRAVRLWWLLRSLYGKHHPWSETLPEPFRYGDVRSRLFADSHGTQDQDSLEILLTNCRGTNCLCQRSLRSLLQAADPQLALEPWLARVAQLTGIEREAWRQLLDQAPFAVVHRSVRDDLKALARQGWVRSGQRGQYWPVAPEAWPTLVTASGPDPLETLSASDNEALRKVLEDVAFVQPQLDVVLDRLWQQGTEASPQRPLWQTEPQKRIFLHLDYILSESEQERVDTYQQAIEQLWRQPDGGVIQFETWMPQREKTVAVTVYPVCLHYVRRAKYLSAYGLDPDGRLNWHNYRLDRIASERLTVLPWGDPRVPKALKAQRDRGELPTPDAVQAQLEEAWGFNFYLPKAWLLMRFSPWFARWYVDGTVRHPTFARVSYGEALAQVERQVLEAERDDVLAVLRQRSAQDVFYAGWVRLGDINVVMRLRDWRPQGEVIAPWGLRQRMVAEVRQEAAHYGEKC